MDNRNIIFEKIEAKEKEWENQITQLQNRVAGFDYNTRIKMENQIEKLSEKLKIIESKTNELKIISSNPKFNIGDNTMHAWIELFTEIDNAMLRLKKQE